MGGPQISEKHMELFREPHPLYAGDWGQLRAQFMAQFAAEGATGAWRRGLADGRELTLVDRKTLAKFRLEERDRVEAAMKTPDDLRIQPGQAEQLYLAGWFAHALAMVVKVSSGEIMHPCINGALADHQSGRVKLRRSTD